MLNSVSENRQRMLADQTAMADESLLRLMGELALDVRSVALLDDSALGELTRRIGRAAEELETLRRLRARAVEG